MATQPNPPQTFSEQLHRVADDYRAQAAALRSADPKDAEAVRLDALADHMTTQAISSDAANDAARVKANLDKWLADHKAVADWHNDNTKSVISMSQASIGLQVTINAGAAVALLAFLGNAINKNAVNVAGLFSGALAVFASGVAVAALVSISSYTTQFLYGRESEKFVRWGSLFHVVTYALAFVSLALFVAGCFQTYNGMRSMVQQSIGGTVQPCPTQSPVTATPPSLPVSSTIEVPSMAEPPVKQPPRTMAKDNAPKPFKTPPPHASVPAPAAPPPPTPPNR